MFHYIAVVLLRRKLCRYVTLVVMFTAFFMAYKLWDTSHSTSRQYNDVIALSHSNPLRTAGKNTAPLNLPWAKADHVPVDKLMQEQWIRDLKSFLATVSPQWPVAIVTTTAKYTTWLLNWLLLALIKAEEPLRNVLVLSTDAAFYQLLHERDIACLYIPPLSIARVEVASKMSEVWIPRVTIMRLINYWGYDVVNYDADAIIVKNPQPIFDRLSSTDVIGGPDWNPKPVYEKLGVTINMGVVLIRATQQTGSIVKV